MKNGGFFHSYVNVYQRVTDTLCDFWGPPFSIRFEMIRIENTFEHI